MKKPLFITFEGGEGSGKTTQSKRLAEYLKSSNIDAIWTREIGGTPAAEKIRDIVIHEDIDVKTQLLLAVAARNEHLIHVILPALAQQKVIICDRFIDSSLCYQGYQLGFDLVLRLHKEILGGIMPDITFFIDIDVQEGLARAGIRGGNNRFEAMPLEVHEKFRENFHKLVEMFPSRIVKIDGRQSQDQIFEIIKERVEKC